MSTGPSPAAGGNRRRALLAESEPLWAYGLRRPLNRYTDLSITGSIGSLSELRRQLTEAEPPDVLFLSDRLGEIDETAECVSLATSRGVRTLVYGRSPELWKIETLLGAGASGYVATAATLSDSARELSNVLQAEYRPVGARLGTSRFAR